MKQSKQAQEMINLMNMVDEVIEEASYPNQNMKGKAGLPDMGPFAKPSAAGPGSSNRGTPNDYTRQQVVDMLNYAAKFINKNAEKVDSWDYGQDWLNMIGSGMKEFMNLKKGSPNQNYEPGTHQKAAGEVSKSGISFGKADKGSASADAKGKAKGDTTVNSKEFDANIDKKKLKYGFSKGSFKGYGEK